MSKDQMSDSIKETWRLIQEWRSQNDGRMPKARDIKAWRPDISAGRLNDHFTWLRRHRFIKEAGVSYQSAKKHRQKQQYQELERIAQELRSRGHG